MIRLKLLSYELTIFNIFININHRIVDVVIVVFALTTFSKFKIEKKMLAKPKQNNLISNFKSQRHEKWFLNTKL